MEGQLLIFILIFLAAFPHGQSMKHQKKWGKCFEGEIYPVDQQKHWIGNSCYDMEGNEYQSNQTILSCCGCIKLACLTEQVPSESYSESFWNVSAKDTCCKDCHGKVYPIGAVMGSHSLGDKCATTVTKQCVSQSQGDSISAVISDRFDSSSCCVDSTGLHQLDDKVILDPKTCSSRKCSLPRGNLFSSWISSLKKCPGSGCGCCVHDGGLVCDGGYVILKDGVKATCCEGELLKAPVSCGEWSPWGDWSPCSATCGVASKERKRECLDPPSPPGLEKETVSCDSMVLCDCKNDVKIMTDCMCSTNICRTNYTCVRGIQCKNVLWGEWYPWGPWSPCSATCGVASKERKRECPIHPCPPGPEKETVSCGSWDACGPFGVDKRCFWENSKLAFLDLGHNHLEQDLKPLWTYSDNGRSLYQEENTRPSIGLSNLGNVKEPVSFSGRAFSMVDDDDVIGMAFGFFNETNFFIVASAVQLPGPTNWYVGRLHATCGSSCATTTTISDAIWDPLAHPGDITVLAMGSQFWHYTSKYRFNVCFNPSQLLLSVNVTVDGEVKPILESGVISAKTNDSAVDDISSQGGRVGVYVNSQAKTTWDDLKCDLCHLIE